MEKRFVVAKVERGGRGKELKFRVSRCRLLYMRWKNNEILLHTTGSIQYPFINQNIKNMNIHTYIYLNHIAVYQKLTQPCKSTTLQ